MRCAVQCVSPMPARTVPGAGMTARAAYSTAPHGHGAEGRWLPTLNAGRTISRALSQATHAAMLGSSWTTCATAPVRKGWNRAFRALGALGPGRGEPGTTAGALMSAIPRRAHRAPHGLNRIQVTRRPG